MQYEVISWKKRWTGVNCCFCGQEVDISGRACKHLIFIVAVSGCDVGYRYRTGAIFASSETLRKYFDTVHNKNGHLSWRSVALGHERIIDAVSRSAKYYLDVLLKIENPTDIYAELPVRTPSFRLFGFSDKYICDDKQAETSDSDAWIVRCECNDCKRTLYYHKNGSRNVTSNGLLTDRINIRSEFNRDLCEVCHDARKYGFYKFQCDGCGELLTGQLNDVEECLNVVSGKNLCMKCQEALRGVYDERNKALMAIVRLEISQPKTKPYVFPVTCPQLSAMERDEIVRLESNYIKEARTLSTNNYKKYSKNINKNNFKIGRPGERGVYQIDHIVPLTVCFKNNVTVDDAASVYNLALIPATLNRQKLNRFLLKNVVGIPDNILEKLNVIYALW